MESRAGLKNYLHITFLSLALIKFCHPCLAQTQAQKQTPIPPRSPTPVAPGLTTAPPSPPAFVPLEAPRPTQPALPLDLRLPTDNRALFEKKPEQFYMGVDRTVDGVTQLVWQGGQYGFVRNPSVRNGETVYTRFHEGIDIAPSLRDAQGEPLDLVCAIAPGTVVYASTKPNASNYGHYVIVEHDWGYGRFYSLYAHLRNVEVMLGQKLSRGAVIGRLGYTGSGIDRRRAHLHLEINILLHQRFTQWHAQKDSSPATQCYHGFNLTGINPADLYLTLALEPKLTLAQFINRQVPYYKIIVPAATCDLDILRRYPWLCPEMLDSRKMPNPPAWEIAFTASGLPIEIRPRTENISQPMISAIVAYQGNHSWRTMGRLTGTGTQATLTAKGQDYLELVTGNF